MRQYIYSPQEARLVTWPSGELRLEGIEVTTNPQEADLFVVPGNLSLFQEGGVIQKERLYKLPYLAGNESRHVVFDVSDNFTKSINMPLLFIRCDARKWMLKDDPGTIQVAWPVEDYSECIDLPEGGFKYDVSFQGWLSTQTRIDSADACQNNPDIKADIATYADFCGYIYHLSEGIRRRAEFRRSMKESRIALCPESIPGVLPYRFFEAMSAGRIPLLVSSDFVLPFDREIPYTDFVIFCESKMASCAGRIVENFVDSHTDEDIQARGLQARHWWKERLDSRDWPRTMSVAVEKKLNWVIIYLTQIVLECPR